MDPSLKENAEKLLQARVDGRLNSLQDILNVINTGSSGIPVTLMSQLSGFISELEPANIIPEAKALAEKYQLNVSYGE